MKPPYQYAAEVVRVIDGDTIDVVLDFGFSLKQKMRLRLAEIDTPELRSKDPEERERAQEAKKFVQEKLFVIAGTVLTERGGDVQVSRELIVLTVKTRAGKERQTFGRYVAVVFFKDNEGSWVNLGNLLIMEGLAVQSPG